MAEIININKDKQKRYEDIQRRTDSANSMDTAKSCMPTAPEPSDPTVWTRPRKAFSRLVPVSSHSHLNPGAASALSQKHMRQSNPNPLLPYACGSIPVSLRNVSLKWEPELKHSCPAISPTVRSVKARRFFVLSTRTLGI